MRRALYHALDRERLLDDVVGGHGVLASSPIPSNNWGHAPDTPSYNYDPDEAQRLLNESGWVDTDGDGTRDKDGLPMQLILLTNDGPNRIALIEQIAADWRAVGVNAVVESVSFAGFVREFLTPRRFDAALLSWDITGDPDSLSPLSQQPDHYRPELRRMVQSRGRCPGDRSQKHGGPGEAPGPFTPSFSIYLPPMCRPSLSTTLYIPMASASASRPFRLGR